MERQVNSQPERPELSLSTQLREFVPRLPRVVRFSAPLFLVILAACNNNGTARITTTTPVDGTPGTNLTALSGDDHILDISDICKFTKDELVACFDVNQDGTVNTEDVNQVRNFVGTTPAYPMDLTGDGQITCDDFNMEEAFVSQHNGEAAESQYQGIPIPDLQAGILTNSISIRVARDTSESAIREILSHSTKYDLIRTDEQGRKNYIILNNPASGDKSVVIQEIPQAVVDAQGFNIAELREALGEAKGVIAVSYNHADIKPAVTFGTPQSCPD